jgi:5-methylcytosine-specific restriction protein A
MNDIGRKAYGHYYRTRAWRERRAHQLRLEPLCHRCGALAAVAHHVTPHRGDWLMFVGGELQSLCKSCHDGAAQQKEKRGYENTIGVDGWPVDDAHPANKRK